MDEQIKTFIQCIEESSHIVAITGAEVSRSAGVMPFDHSNPEAERLVELLGSEDLLRNRPEEYFATLDEAFLQPLFQVGPGPVHQALARIERRDKIDGIITTNIDCLHTIAGSKNVLELQGSLNLNRCVECWEEYNDYRIWENGGVPKCTRCGNPIWSMPFYSHMRLDEMVMREARRLINQADLILLVGTNGSYSNLYWKYRNRRAKIVQINPESTSFDKASKVTIRDDVDHVFAELETAF